jgi:hypothetical protein
MQNAKFKMQTLREELQRAWPRGVHPVFAFCIFNFELHQ